jgi:hypothetical protein
MSAQESARLYDEIAAELHRAAAHARRTAEHFRDGDVPRAAAHAWATQGTYARRRRGSTRNRVSTLVTPSRSA